LPGIRKRDAGLGEQLHRGVRYSPSARQIRPLRALGEQASKTTAVDRPPRRLQGRFEVVVAGGIGLRVAQPHRIGRSALGTTVEPA